jgi:hypothetical protein
LSLPALFQWQETCQKFGIAERFRTFFEKLFSGQSSCGQLLIPDLLVLSVII